MVDEKAPLSSKTIIASIITLAVSLLAMLGYTISPEEQDIIIGAVSAVITSATAIWAIAARVRATKVIRTRK